MEELFSGKDGIIRAAKLRTEKGHMERPMQQLCPLELACDKPASVEKKTELNPDATPFRPERSTAIVARLLIQQEFEDNDN